MLRIEMAGSRAIKWGVGERGLENKEAELLKLGPTRLHDGFAANAWPSPKGQT